MKVSTWLGRSSTTLVLSSAVTAVMEGRDGRVWLQKVSDECRCCASVCRQGAAAYPDNEDQQQRLREAAEGLRVATNAAAQNAIKKKLVNRLEVSDQCQLQSQPPDRIQNIRFLPSLVAHADIPISAVSGKICV